MRYQHFQNSASLVIENVDITLGKPREISKLSQTRQASWAKVLISHEKACDKCIIYFNIPTIYFNISLSPWRPTSNIFADNKLEMQFLIDSKKFLQKYWKLMELFQF